jgi:uncharacterized protein YbcV (DUF1398 family)
MTDFLQSLEIHFESDHHEDVHQLFLKTTWDKNKDGELSFEEFLSRVNNAEIFKKMSGNETKAITLVLKSIMQILKLSTLF